jgi:hypothetical protein
MMIHSRAYKIMAAGAFCAAAVTLCSASQAADPPSQLKIVSAKIGAGTKFVLPASITEKVVTRATVPVGTATVINAWIVVNQTTCVASGPGVWDVKTQPANGTLTTGTITSTLADGNCPGVEFTFGALAYTPDAKQKTSDKFEAFWRAKYKGVMYAVENGFRIRSKG